jgi:hypothetical protein
MRRIMKSAINDLKFKIHIRKATKEKAQKIQHSKDEDVKTYIPINSYGHIHHHYLPYTTYSIHSSWCLNIHTTMHLIHINI